jgi:hypothetical protein
MLRSASTPHASTGASPSHDYLYKSTSDQVLIHPTWGTGQHHCHGHGCCTNDLLQGLGQSLRETCPPEGLQSQHVSVPDTTAIEGTSTVRAAVGSVQPSVGLTSSNELEDGIPGSATSGDCEQLDEAADYHEWANLTKAQRKTARERFRRKVAVHLSVHPAQYDVSGEEVSCAYSSAGRLPKLPPGASLSDLKLYRIKLNDKFLSASELQKIDKSLPAELLQKFWEEAQQAAFYKCLYCNMVWSATSGAWYHVANCLLKDSEDKGKQGQLEQVLQSAGWVSHALV